jgi:ankyrin repeat protein
MTRTLRTAAILASIHLPVSVIAADAPVIEQLFQAAKIGSLEQVKALLAKGADVNAKDLDGRTVLNHALIRPDRPEIVQYLKARGAK